MVHGVAELDLVAAEQLIRPSWNRHAIAAELAQSGFDVALAEQVLVALSRSRPGRTIATRSGAASPNAVW